MEEKRAKNTKHSSSGRKQNHFESQSNVAESSAQTRATAETIKDEAKTCKSVCFTFANNRLLERTLQRSSPASVFSYLFSRRSIPPDSNLNPSPSSSLCELLSLAVAWHLALHSAHIFPVRRGPVTSRSDAAAPFSSHLPARTGALPRRNMPHRQRISAAAGGKSTGLVLFPHPPFPSSLSLTLSFSHSPLMAFTLDPVQNWFHRSELRRDDKQKCRRCKGSRESREEGQGISVCVCARVSASLSVCVWQE